MRALHYVDFDLRLEREGERYTARVIESPAGEAASAFVLPFPADRIFFGVPTTGHYELEAMHGVFVTSATRSVRGSFRISGRAAFSHPVTDECRCLGTSSRS